MTFAGMISNDMVGWAIGDRCKISSQDGGKRDVTEKLHVFVGPSYHLVVSHTGDTQAQKEILKFIEAHTKETHLETMTEYGTTLASLTFNHLRALVQAACRNLPAESYTTALQKTLEKNPIEFAVIGYDGSELNRRIRIGHMLYDHDIHNFIFNYIDQHHWEIGGGAPAGREFLLSQLGARRFKELSTLDGLYLISNEIVYSTRIATVEGPIQLIGVDATAGQEGRLDDVVRLYTTEEANAICWLCSSHRLGITPQNTRWMSKQLRSAYNHDIDFDAVAKAANKSSHDVRYEFPTYNALIETTRGAWKDGLARKPVSF